MLGGSIGFDWCIFKSVTFDILIGGFGYLVVHLNGLCVILSHLNALVFIHGVNSLLLAASHHLLNHSLRTLLCVFVVSNYTTEQPLSPALLVLH